MGHSVVVELNMAAIIRYPLSLGRPSVVCPCLWWCRHCCQKKGHEPYTSHGTCCIFVMFWCIMNLISRDQIYIAWSCDFYDLIMWPTLYIAQSCAFNARSCYIYIYFLILWPIPPDLVTYIARSCELYRPILWPIPPDLVTFFIQFCPKYTSPELVNFITWSCDLYPQCCVL